MVIETLQHPMVNSSLKYASTTVGRDKVYRAAQNFARFMAWYLLRQGYDKATIQRWEALKKNMSLSRKLMRLGKPVEHLQSASKAWNEKDEVLKFTSTFRQLSYAGYLLLDTFVWLNGTGIYKIKQIKTIAERSMRFWMAGLIFSILSSLYKLYGISLRYKNLRASLKGSEKGVGDPDDIKSRCKDIEKEREPVVRQLVQDSLDLILPMKSLKYIDLDDGLVGLAGFITSIMGVQTQWRKVNGK
ncbi:1015_t:CDS:2 [Paraglomus occultum]|uniref:1015_t:CDS:1 n=1 Tax=Paraglomus occultum TaxID=144539 RepID=A0A9N8VLE7_9GLOM|nr:1015_t:CDS:2 [Paraglomus occultum]